MSRFRVSTAGRASEFDRNVQAIAGLCGIDAELFCPAQSAVGPSLAGRSSGSTALALSADLLCETADPESFLDAVAGREGNSVAQVLIYGFRPGPRHEKMVTQLTGGKVAGIRPTVTGDRYSFPANSREHTRQLAGCEFERSRAPEDCHFDLAAGQATNELMAVAGKPVLVQMRRAASNLNLYLWTSGDSIPEPATRIAEPDFIRGADRFLPLIVFLRAAFPGGCWENSVKTGRIIIDDPLLRSRYGFMKYADLLNSATRLGYGFTTAFIPWNYRRTGRRAARFFAAQAPAHTICVHGCDHTSHEFGGTETGCLEAKAFTAVERMRAHGERTGIAWDKVMVFPQGKFSTTAVAALRRAGFLAVVNTTRIPTDADGRGFNLAEELMPAVTCLSGVPIFIRRYPGNLTACALDLFLGRPAHVVEHHEWFSQGHAGMEHCVAWLKGVEPELTWPSLTEALRQQHLYRRESGAGQVRFFTPEFGFGNPADHEGPVRFSKSEPDPGRVDRVLVDGQPVPFTQANGLLEFSIQLRAAQLVSVQLVDRSQAETRSWSPGARYQAKVGIRRFLSEVRDDHLARHPRVLKLAKRIAGRSKSSIA